MLYHQVKHGIQYLLHTVWKSSGGGTRCFLPKSLRGSRLSGKIAWGGSPYYFMFYCVFINKCFEICLRGVLYLPSHHLTPTSPPPHPHLTPTCVHLWYNTCCKDWIVKCTVAMFAIISVPEATQRIFGILG